MSRPNASIDQLIPLLEEANNLEAKRLVASSGHLYIRQVFLHRWQLLHELASNSRVLEYTDWSGAIGHRMVTRGAAWAVIAESENEKSPVIYGAFGSGRYRTRICDLHDVNVAL